MKLFKKGDRGREVSDIQGRLVTSGFLHEGSEEQGGSYFGPQTESAVSAFQQHKGLIVDGVVGPDTWRALVESSRSLGSRFLYLREPPLRGDDVVELQRRLNGLGFYTGKEDGIFDNDAAVAVEQFQRNCGLPPDGILGTKTVEALLRLSRVTKPTSVALIRESESGLPTGGIRGRRIMIDPGHGYPPDAGEIGPSGLRESEVAEKIAEFLGRLLVEKRAVVLYSRRKGEYFNDSERAQLANRQAVDLLVSVHLNGSVDSKARGASSFFFARGNYRSPYGYRLANHILDRLVSALGLPDCRVHGRAFPILRETRMPVVIVEPAFITNPEEERLLASDDFLEGVSRAIAEGTQRYFDGFESQAERESPASRP